MNRTSAVACLAFFCAASAHAQVPGAQQSTTIPIRQVTSAVSSDSGVISSIYGLRGLPGNRVVVNDYFGKRVVLFDEAAKRAFAAPFHGAFAG